VLHKTRDFDPLDPKLEALYDNPMISPDHLEKTIPDLRLAADASKKVT